MQKSTFEARIVPMERKKNRRTSAHPETQKREAAPFVWEIRGAAPVLGSAPEKPAALRRKRRARFAALLEPDLSGALHCQWFHSPE